MKYQKILQLRISPWKKMRKNIKIIFGNNITPEAEIFLLRVQFKWKVVKNLFHHCG